MNLSLREKRLLLRSIRSIGYDHPELEGLNHLKQEICLELEANLTWQKGKEMYQSRIGDIGDGHLDPQDYFFAVKHHDIIDWDNNPTGEKYVQLLLCYKWEWYMNGEAYVHNESGQESRNFDRFITPEMRKRYDVDGQYTDNPDELREQLIKAGLEEKPEILHFYDEYLQATRKRRAAILDERLEVEKY